MAHKNSHTEIIDDEVFNVQLQLFFSCQLYYCSTTNSLTTLKRISLICFSYNIQETLRSSFSILPDHTLFCSYSVYVVFSNTNATFSTSAGVCVRISLRTVFQVFGSTCVNVCCVFINVRASVFLVLNAKGNEKKRRGMCSIVHVPVSSYLSYEVSIYR